MRLKSSHCPYCQCCLDSAFDPELQDRVPRPGDLTCCIKCGELSQYTDQFDLEPFLISDLDPEQQPQIKRYQALIAKAGYDVKLKETPNQ